MQKSAGTSERHTIILLFLTLLWEINYVNVAKRSPSSHSRRQWYR